MHGITSFMLIHLSHNIEIRVTPQIIGFILFSWKDLNFPRISCGITVSIVLNLRWISLFIIITCCNTYIDWYICMPNSLNPDDCSCILNVIFKHILMFDIFSISYETAHRWRLQNFFNDKSTLVDVVGSCCQATSCNFILLNQCWRSSMTQI